MVSAARLLLTIFSYSTIFISGTQSARIIAPSSTVSGPVTASWSLDSSDPSSFVLALIQDDDKGETTQTSLTVNSHGKSTGFVTFAPQATATGTYRIQMITGNNSNAASSSSFGIIDKSKGPHESGAHRHSSSPASSSSTSITSSSSGSTQSNTTILATTQLSSSNTTTPSTSSSSITNATSPPAQTSTTSPGSSVISSSSVPPSPSGSLTQGATKHNSDGSSFVAAIVGAVLGTLLLVIVLVAGFLLWLRRRNRARAVFPPIRPSSFRSDSRLEYGSPLSETMMISRPGSVWEPDFASIAPSDSVSRLVPKRRLPSLPKNAEK